MEKQLKPNEFISYLEERFGIALPTEFEVTSSDKHGLRIHNKGVHSSIAWGVKGFGCYVKGITNSFIMLFGHLAKKNIIALNGKDLKNYFSGKEIKKKIKIKEGEVVLAYKGHVVGMGKFNNGVIISSIKKSREINNDLNSYPGRNL